MLNVKSLISNFSVALLAQGVAFVVSCLVSLLLPAFIDVAEFGYWQLFILFTNYVGFFHLGINDGVYLIEGGTPREEIDKPCVTSQFMCAVFYQCVMAVAIIAVALLGPFEESRRFVLIAAAIFLLLSNFTNYWGFVFQAMNETKLYSATVAINRLIFLVPLLACIALGCKNFQTYVVFYLVAQGCALLFSLYHARDFLAAKLLSLAQAWKTTWQTITVGIKLMFASLCGILITGIVQFFVDGMGDIELFSKFSFALSMVGFFMIFVYQASMVLFPALRQTSEDEQKGVFVAARDALDLILPVVYLLYFPAVALLMLWLPQYAMSFSLFALLLPMCVFDGKMDLIGSTYLKVIRGESLLFKINAAALALCVVLVALNAYCIHSVELLALSISLVLALRSLVTEWLLERALKVNHSLLGLECLVFSALFVALAWFAPTWIAICVCALCYALYLVINRARLMSCLHSLKDIAKK